MFQILHGDDIEACIRLSSTEYLSVFAIVDVVTSPTKTRLSSAHATSYRYRTTTKVEKYEGSRGRRCGAPKAHYTTFLGREGS